MDPSLQGPIWCSRLDVTWLQSLLARGIGSSWNPVTLKRKDPFYLLRYHFSFTSSRLLRHMCAKELNSKNTFGEICTLKHSEVVVVVCWLAFVSTSFFEFAALLRVIACGLILKPGLSCLKPSKTSKIFIYHHLWPRLDELTDK